VTVGVRELSGVGATIARTAAEHAQGPAMTQPDVYLLAGHEPYTDPRHPVPINATIVHAATLLHPQVPQPDGGMIYRCLTEFPDRRPHQIVPVSTLSYELDGGRLWPQVADWMIVVEALVPLARAGACDAMPLGLTPLQAFLVAQGPGTDNVVHYTDGTSEHRGPEHRQQVLDDLTTHLRRFLADGPFWPGNNLVPVPGRPAALPYQPYRYASR
jgi:hypothetical protein